MHTFDRCAVSCALSPVFPLTPHACPSYFCSRYCSVFGDDASQVEVYESSVRPMVGQFLSGYNATVLAYGQVRLTGAH
jgi:hypothetical protein